MFCGTFKAVLANDTCHFIDLMEENFENEELVLDPEFGLNSEQETDSSDEEAELLDSDVDMPLADLLPLAGISKHVDMPEHVYR